MEQMKEEATRIMLRERTNAEKDEETVKRYEEFPKGYLLDWPTKAPGTDPWPESADDYNKRVEYGPRAIEDPDSFEVGLELRVSVRTSSVG